MKKISSIMLLFLFAVGAYGQTETPKESLRGLKGIYVNVVPVAENVRKDGLSTERVHQVVANQLRAAGINIHTQPQASDGYANLIVEPLKEKLAEFIADFFFSQS